MMRHQQINVLGFGTMVQNLLVADLIYNFVRAF